MALRLKPRFLRDISTKKSAEKNTYSRDVFSFGLRRVNLHYAGDVNRAPVFFIARVAIFFAAASFLLLGSVFAPTSFNRASGQSSDDERAGLEAQLRDLEDQMSQYEDQIVGYQKQGKTFKDEIARLNGKVAKLNLQIQAVNLTIKDLDSKIVDTRGKIAVTEDTIDSHKASLGRLFQGLYENERASLIEVFLRNPQISDFFDSLRGITLIQSNLRLELENIKDLREELGAQNEQLNLARADAESARNYSASQKIEIDGVKSEKNRLLEITKGQESKYQDLLKQTKETVAEIRKRIFKLLGGGELSFEEAYEYAKLAGAATGMRPAFILAVLDRESALGQNVGRCSYKTAMSPSNQEIFLQITRKLNIDPDIVQVSCPNRDGVYGGAMGPAQFIPSTWILYDNLISKVTGNNPPSPWNNSDAFVATALYLKDSYNSKACADYSKEIPSQEQTLRERCAAAKYYAGGRWYYYRWTYGEAVVIHARRFQEDIDTITS